MLADQPLRRSEPRPSDAAPYDWGLVEIFGHRRHYGRISEIERFGVKMLRVDVPTQAAAPLLGEPETFETFEYGGAAIFGITAMTEEACRAWAARDRTEAMPLRRLPAPDLDDPDFEEPQF